MQYHAINEGQFKEAYRFICTHIAYYRCHRRHGLYSNLSLSLLLSLAFTYRIFSLQICNSNILQIPNILLHHEGFLEDLKARLENWDAKKTIGDWFLECVRIF